MPKDLLSFFKPVGAISTSKPRSPSPKKVDKKVPTPKKDPTPKKAPSPQKAPPPKSSSHKSSRSLSREKKSEKKRLAKDKKEEEDLFIDDGSEDDIVSDTPPRKEESKKSTTKKAKTSKMADDDADFESLKRKPTFESSDEEIKPKRRQKKPKIEESTVEQVKKSKKKKAMVIDSESEEEVVEKKPRKPRKKKEVVPLIGVSDDDTPVVNPLKEAFSHAKPAPKSEPKQAKLPEKKAPVSVTDFFGSAAVRRTDRPSSLKRKSDAIELHSDDEFERTLAQIDLDNLEQPAKKAKTQAGTLTEKIAAKMSKTLVEDTPVKDKNPNNNNNTQKPTHSKMSGEIETKRIPKKEPEPIKIEKTPSEPITTEKTPPKLMTIEKTPSKAMIKSEKSPTPTTPLTKTPSTPSSSKPASTPSSDAKKSGYLAFKTRSGPQALGSKEIPEGAQNCLEGLTFVITGVQESIDRDQLKSLLERYGAKVTTSLSKKTTYLITGRDAGETKLNKASQLGTKVIEEDEVFELIRTTPGKVSKYELEAKATAEKEAKLAKKTRPKTPPKEKTSSLPSTPKSRSDLNSQASHGTASPQVSETSQLTASPQVTECKAGEQLLWVDKYKPKTLRNIIGQQGDKSNAKKLMNWLRCWYGNVSSGKKPNFANRWSDDGSGYRAALLSGPPGIGKTTTAHLVCEEAGFSFIEMNASDARSKKTLESEVAEMLQCRNLDRMFGAKREEKSKAPTHCLVMDEVDGMAGNEDRGGMAELICLIKKSSIPIICICNDRQSMKIRSLANHCFDLRFQKPRLEQIKSAMMSIAFKEGLKVPPPALNEIILASNQDVRQVIHNLAMWSAGDKAMSYDQTKKDANNARKDIKIGPFDVVRRVFSSSEESGSINDKADLFFNDYSIGPLFVAENYVQVQPVAAKGNQIKHLALLSQAADSIAEGDVISGKIRSSQSWSLLPLQAIASSVIPGELMRGYLGQQITFPSWLGKNSTTNKNRRLLEDINSHMHLKVSCDKDGLNLDYRTYLKNALYKPLLKEDGEGVQETMDLLEGYDLMKEDFESLLELSQWGSGGKAEGMTQVQSKTKAALTRKCNQSSRKLPYVTGSGAKIKRSAETFDEEGNLIEQEAGAESDEDISKITSIKAVKPKAKAEGKKTSSQAGKGKGKGKKSK